MDFKIVGPITDVEIIATGARDSRAETIVEELCQGTLAQTERNCESRIF